ncbi:hypothetical protein [Pseudomonas sp. ENNP23]|uniref:hypothetical protein n=1 Tax=Pseudomonas sp. ENNP23 TaxID=1535636 RepID=UPI00084AB395|nr:hypothetical protein [Pseudomonas sp. ENNP23]OEC61288.1 hypothetical protein A9G05_04060 [Pseudomonas sp. ENNP23]
MKPKFINNWATKLVAELDASAESMTVEPAKAAALGSLAGGYYVLTLCQEDASDDDSGEIVKAVAVAGSAITLQRGQEGTTARAWPAGTRVYARWTAGTAQALLDAAAAGGGGSSSAYTITALWGGSETTAGGELVGLYPVGGDTNTPGQTDRYAYLLEEDIGSSMGLLPGYLVGRVLTAGAAGGAPVQVLVGGTCTLADLKANTAALPAGTLDDWVGAPVCLLGGGEQSFAVTVGAAYLNGRGPDGEAPATAEDLRVATILVVGYLTSGQDQGTVTLHPQPILIDLAGGGESGGESGSGSTISAADLLRPGGVELQLMGSLAAPFALRALKASPAPPSGRGRYVLERTATGYAWRRAVDPLGTPWVDAMTARSRTVVPDVWGGWWATWHEMECGYAGGGFAISERVIQQHHYLNDTTADTLVVQLPAGFNDTVRTAYSDNGINQLGGYPDLFVEVTVTAGNARTWRFEPAAGASLYPAGPIELSAPGHHARFRCDPRTGVWYASGNWS